MATAPVQSARRARARRRPEAGAAGGAPRGRASARGAGIPGSHTAGASDAHGAGTAGASLDETTGLLRLLSDASRVRLLHLLHGQELTVAELTGACRLAQSRVSSHLGKLRAAGFLRVRRAGTSTYYALHESGLPADAARLWDLLRERTDDGLLAEDRQRLAALLRARQGSWADSVAGSMERHYSPGRTWEAAARALVGLARLGRVLDIASGDGALAELLAPRATSVTCLDLSPRVVEAGDARLAKAGGPRARCEPSRAPRDTSRAPHDPSRVRFLRGDMHALPFADAAFDEVLLLNALTFARDPRRVVQEAARVLAPGGTLLAVALRAHRHAAAAAAFDHVQNGFVPMKLRSLFERAGCEVSLCEVTSREKQPPHFEIITVHAHRRGKTR